MAEETAKTQKLHWTKVIFVFGTVSFCLVVSTMMGFDPAITSKVAEIVADGFISLALFVSVTFLAAETVDRSEILKRIASRTGVQAASIDPKVLDTPTYNASYATAYDPSLANDDAARG